MSEQPLNDSRHEEIDGKDLARALGCCVEEIEQISMRGQLLSTLVVRLGAAARQHDNSQRAVRYYREQLAAVRECLLVLRQVAEDDDPKDGCAYSDAAKASLARLDALPPAPGAG